ncbi:MULTISPECIES: helix-turn-helix domain-containing protein [unclassified Leucobacter]|uniref:helix-turn-helix domain-containing protein n=1 Tax=unclassified Leucobacter TaxID=2621730 RepID=UPI00165D9BD0|nr:MULTISPECIES: helix-turn-helix domain-containing protein [unclassified Leucobacter]MBC9936013.1 helix-turn-helix transcriptional regulator [Leucobacter sp. cx-87]
MPQNEGERPLESAAGFPFAERINSATLEVRETIAANTRRARLLAGMSVRELAERAHLSPALISQIERGVANTTVDTLVKLAEVLNLSFPDLTWRYVAEPHVVRADEGEMEIEPAGTVRTLFGSTDRRRFTVSIGTTDPNSMRDPVTHGIGSVEYSVVISGEVTVVTPDWSVHLRRGDAVRFSGEFPHSYRTGDSPSEVLTLVASTDDWDTTRE